MPPADNRSSWRAGGRFYWPLIAIVEALAFSGCEGPNGTPGNDASGMDSSASMDLPADMTMTGETTGMPDGGNDAGLDTSAADTGPSDTGSIDAGDGGSDPCKPPCLYKLVGGCLPEGSCVRSGASYCYANGVKQIALPPGMLEQSYYSKNGVVCARVQAGGTFVDPNGVVLGTLGVNTDGSSVATCTGESPVVIPATCVSPAANCSVGTCMP